jgi:hypothetical protein
MCVIFHIHNAAARTKTELRPQDGCVDEQCFVPTYHVTADHMSNETMVIRTRGQPSRADADRRLGHYHTGKLYTCYYRGSDPLAIRFAPRAYGVFVAGATISWLLIIAAVIATVLACYYR